MMLIPREVETGPVLCESKYKSICMMLIRALDNPGNIKNPVGRIGT
jgi:hypothetical protein